MNPRIKFALTVLFWVLALGLFLHIYSLKFSDVNFQNNVLKVNGIEYNVVLESNFPSTYVGLLENKNLFYDSRYPFLLGDLVVTSGRYRGNLVNLRLANHHLDYEVPWGITGNVYVIHPIATNPEIATKMRNLIPNKMVQITGIEVYEVTFKDGRYWRDNGCHTLLITSVSQ